jgi:hypothetical protein
VLYGPLIGAGARWSAVLGVLTAVALLAIGVPVRSLILLGFGTAGVVVFAPITVLRFLGDTLGALPRWPAAHRRRPAHPQAAKRVTER